MNTINQVDSFRFLDRITAKLVRSWVEIESSKPIPWTPLSKPLEECSIALISSAGLALKSDQPFDQEGEKRNPWWGDPSYRKLPCSTRPGEVALYHLHINPNIVERDLNTLFPLQRLLELERSGEIGQAAPCHYSYMGYILQPQELLERSVPALIRDLKGDGVDAVLLVPG